MTEPQVRRTRLGGVPPAPSGTEDGAHGRLVAFNVDDPTDVIESEYAGRQAETDRGVGAEDCVEIPAVMRADLYARARRPHLKQRALDPNPHRR